MKIGIVSRFANFFVLFSGDYNIYMYIYFCCLFSVYLITSEPSLHKKYFFFRIFMSFFMLIRSEYEMLSVKPILYGGIYTSLPR